MYSGNSVLLNFAMRWPVLVPLAALGSVVSTEAPQAPAQVQSMVVQSLTWVTKPLPVSAPLAPAVQIAVGP